MAQSNIILGITPSPYATLVLPPSMDMCGSGRRHMSESYPECRTPKNYSGLGLPPHTGPKRKDFISLESRAKSFMGWPDGVKQTPKELAEAGFSYCGLSDHVRCFYCDNGLRNWEKEDDPWEEHARWYPECKFVLVKKGQEFIDRVRREKPPYLRSQPPPSNSGPPSERELDSLMELDIIDAMLGMGFPTNKVRPALRRKLEITGLPFFNLEACIEAVLQYMEEESRLTLTSSPARSLEFEAASQQGAKMQALQSAHESHISLSSSSLTPTTNTSAGDEISSSLSSSTGSSQHSPTSSSSTEEPITESSPITSTQEVLNAAPTSSSSPTAVKLLPSSGDSAGTGKPQDHAVEEGLDLKDMCKVCMNAELDMVFLPCTHMVTCSSCALALTQCPICRGDIKYAIKPILS
ncbi:Baculoviral IAP repeat-containing protein 2 [Portunus trituberculatus]|uniref:Baculoviral IAP repeat-containing protein 2 n=2 Tax=Portunus trituberculatus TaxID=210409 RepID=A0A5B7H088_PORTR|nr:Baculoviral IAP repeat-containing protein 2 [Portunus trituberculatus]